MNKKGINMSTYADESLENERRFIARNGITFFALGLLFSISGLLPMLLHYFQDVEGINSIFDWIMGLTLLVFLILFLKAAYTERDITSIFTPTSVDHDEYYIQLTRKAAVRVFSWLFLLSMVSFFLFEYILDDVSIPLSSFCQLAAGLLALLYGGNILWIYHQDEKIEQ